MTTKRFAIHAIVFGVVCGLSASAFASDKHRDYWHRDYWHRDHRAHSERYVPADHDLLYVLFGGPRYYDQQLFTTAAGACSYHRTGPDANALNKINDHHCGK